MFIKTFSGSLLSGCFCIMILSEVIDKQLNSLQDFYEE